MDVEGSDQGYGSQAPLQPLVESHLQQDIETHHQPIQPNATLVESLSQQDNQRPVQSSVSPMSQQPSVSVVESLSQQDDQQPMAITTQVPSLDVSLGSDAISAGSQSTSPTELPETLDSGLGSEPFTVMSESSSQSQPGISLPAQPAISLPAQPAISLPTQPAISLPAQPAISLPTQPAYDVTSEYTATGVSLLEEPSPISVSTTLPISSELSASLQPEPAALAVPSRTSTADSGYSTTTVLESGSMPDQHVAASHSQTVVPNLTPTPPTGQPAEETAGLLESSAIPALIPEHMSLEQLHDRVKEYFPSFKPYGILQFLSLLGPGSPSSLPNVWKGAKKPKRRRKEGDRKGGITATWELDKEFTPPPPEMCMSDDEVSQCVIGCAVW